MVMRRNKRLAWKVENSSKEVTSQVSSGFQQKKERKKVEYMKNGKRRNS